MEKRDSGKPNSTAISPLSPLFCFSAYFFYPTNSVTSIDNVSTNDDCTADNDYPERLKALEKTHPKLGRFMYRLYHWRVLYISWIQYSFASSCACLANPESPLGCFS